jgi:hypothetical protein
LPPQRREEARPELQADGEHEEDEAELLHEVEDDVVDLLAEVPEQDAREQHPRRAQADPSVLERAERQAGHGHRRQHQERVRDGLGLCESLEGVHP